MYMGYKKLHSMKFQAVTLPNRLIRHLSGPYPTLQNDAGVLMERELLIFISECFVCWGFPHVRHYIQQVSNALRI